MITYWQEENGRFIRQSQETLDTSKRTWIDARTVSREDIQVLETKFHIENEHILDILDQDELSRIEKDEAYTLLIIRLPIFIPENEVSYFTVPLGIILFEDTIITICSSDCEVLRDISSNRIRGITLQDLSAFVMRILSKTDSVFLRYLKEINRRSNTIQSELQLSVKNKELLQLLNLEKSLEFFTTSLKSNQLLLEKLSKTGLLKLDKEDKEWLEDVEIDNKQAIEMTDTYRNILSGMMDAFASVISNNLNIVMKRLTVVSLILMVPTFIVSFFGMNIPLPFTNNGWYGIVFVSLLCIASTFIAHILLQDKTPRLDKKTKTIKQIKNLHNKELRKEKKRMKKILLNTLFLVLFFNFPLRTAESQEIKQSFSHDSLFVSFVTQKEEQNLPPFVLGEHMQTYPAKRQLQSFQISRYETSYQFWYIVRIWAEKNGYMFSNPGQEGSAGRRGKRPTSLGAYEPVTTINWRDAVIWCNALSELQKLTPVYRYNGEILRNSENAAEVDLVQVNFSANGYRLPTEAEWEFAARKTETGFQRGDTASGAGYNDQIKKDLTENQISWNSSNTIKTQTIGTAGLSLSGIDSVGQGNPNNSGIFDMSGNVLEFCFDWFANDIGPQENLYPCGKDFGKERIARGGSWSPFASYNLAGDRYGYDPDEAYNYLGFRLARSISLEELENNDYKLFENLSISLEELQ